MHVYCLRSPEELSRYAGDWDALARGVPFRHWTWLAAWWRHYGDAAGAGRRNLLVPMVFDERERPVGLGPWYVEHTATGAQVLRMLGDGEVCSDYLSVPCLPGYDGLVAEALADFLTDTLPREGVAWDAIDLSGVDAEDHAAARLVAQLADRGNKVDVQPGPNCWRLNLPTDADGYPRMIAKNPRRQLRKLKQEYLDTGRGVLRFIESREQLSGVMEMFRGMLQRRRQSLGETGPFASPRFAHFYEEVFPNLFGEGRGQIAWLEIDGRPVAADYLISGDGVLYAYQGAIEPGACKLKPGKAFYAALLQWAIARGYRGFDFLRGDEHYKSQLGAVPRASTCWRVVARRTTARLRHSLWLAGRNVKKWIKHGLKTVQGK